MSLLAHPCGYLASGENNKIFQVWSPTLFFSIVVNPGPTEKEVQAKQNVLQNPDRGDPGEQV